MSDFMGQLVQIFLSLTSLKDNTYYPVCNYWRKDMRRLLFLVVVSELGDCSRYSLHVQISFINTSHKRRHMENAYYRLLTESSILAAINLLTFQV